MPREYGQSPEDASRKVADYKAGKIDKPRQRPETPVAKRSPENRPSTDPVPLELDEFSRHVDDPQRESLSGIRFCMHCNRTAVPNGKTCETCRPKRANLMTQLATARNQQIKRGRQLAAELRTLAQAATSAATAADRGHLSQREIGRVVLAAEAIRERFGSVSPPD